MTVTEQALHRLHCHLEETMGEEHAAALMEWLPEGPLASKVDIDGLHAEIRHLREIMDFRWEHTATKADVQELRAEMHRGFTRQTWSLVTAFAALNGITLAAARLV